MSISETITKAIKIYSTVYDTNLVPPSAAALETVMTVKGKTVINDAVTAAIVSEPVMRAEHSFVVPASLIENNLIQISSVEQALIDTLVPQPVIKAEHRFYSTLKRFQEQSKAVEKVSDIIHNESVHNHYSKWLKLHYYSSVLDEERDLLKNDYRDYLNQLDEILSDVDDFTQFEWIVEDLKKEAEEHYNQARHRYYKAKGKLKNAAKSISVLNAGIDRRSIFRRKIKTFIRQIDEEEDK